MMKVIGVVPGTKRIEIIEREKPQLPAKGTDIDGLVVKVKEVGISLNDRRIAAGETFEMPSETKHIVLGREMLGHVVDNGPMGDEVTGINIGDLIVPMSWHGCGQCTSCARRNVDLCLTGLYKEHGSHLLDGFMMEYVVEAGKYAISIPPDLEDIAVLLTPLSIAVKALNFAVQVNHRMDYPYPFPEHSYHSKEWGVGKTALIVGGGDMAILSAFLLRLNSVDTYLMADNPKDGVLASIVEQIGGNYIKNGDLSINQLTKETGRLDFLFEATGSQEFNPILVEHLDECGVMAIMSLPVAGTKVNADINRFIHERVLRNQIIFGAVSAGHLHYMQAVDEMQRIKKQFGNAIKNIITHRYSFQEIEKALPTAADGELIKALLEFDVTS